MRPIVDDQNEAWRRLTEARLKTLEAAVQPRRVRRRRDGKPLPALPYEPGDRKPLTNWLEIRLLAHEMLLRILLDVDRDRSDEEGICVLEDLMDEQLDTLDDWSGRQLEPDLSRRETMAVILHARLILMEMPTWPLIEIEEMEL